MSHLEEREEKICLNCNTQLIGRYCHVCGQENVEPKESFWHLATHFIYDVTHFDGKFFSTLKYLLLKPGRLATEYLAGRRGSYLHPIRMYIFTSAIFFVVFFSFIVKPEEIGESVTKAGNAGLYEAKQSIRESIDSTSDSAERRSLVTAFNALDKITVKETANGKVKVVKKDTVRVAAPKITVDTTHTKDDGPDLNKGSHWKIQMTDKKLPPTVEAYDSLQKQLPENKRDGWFERISSHRYIAIQQKYHGNDSEFEKSLLEKFLHTIPQMMFVSLPFVALILQLLYVRRRKQFYYVSHVIFIIYVYIAVFVLLMVTFGLNGLYTWLKFAPLHWLDVLVTIYIFVYCLLAMHNFYKQGYVKSFLKYLLLFFICSVLSALIMSAFFFTSLMSV